MFDKLSEFGPLLVGFFVFPLIASLIFRLPRKIMWPTFALLNLFGTFAVADLSYVNHFKQLPDKLNHQHGQILAIFCFYMVLVLASFLALKSVKKESPRSVAFAYLAPLLMLVTLRDLVPIAAHVDRSGGLVILVGVSYVSFKLCQLVSEYLNGTVPLPNVWQYISFALFLPLLFVGPIASYSTFYSENFPPKSGQIDKSVAILRVLVGIVKYVFLSALLAQFSYGIAFLGDGHFHGALDVCIAILAYPLYLYCNFSGMCDISVGVSGLMGFEVIENFDRPFLARNFQEFWSRWHISLSMFMRVMVFTPFVKWAGRRVSTKAMPHVIAMGLMLCFIAVGLWHGTTLNFLLFGISQGIGVCGVHYGGGWLRKRLSKQQLQSYRSSRPIYWLGVGATYLYFALTMILFANTLDHLKEIVANIR